MPHHRNGFVALCWLGTVNVNVRTNKVLRKNYQSNVNTLIKTKNKQIDSWHTQCSKSKEHNIKWSHAHVPVPVIVIAMFKVILFALFLLSTFSFMNQIPILTNKFTFLI